MLSDTQIRSTKPAAKALRLYDERGPYLEITPSGGRWWRLKYRHDGREKLLSMGTGDPVPLYAVHLYSRHRLRRVAVMLEFLVEAFGQPSRAGLDSSLTAAG
jgi:hypothetical protein